MKRIRDQIQERSGERNPFTEREVLKLLMEFLEDSGWKVKEQIEINGGRIDVGAEKEGTTLLVEVKGEDRGGYTSAQMNFQMGLGQLISRHDSWPSRYLGRKYFSSLGRPSSVVRINVGSRSRNSTRL